MKRGWKILIGVVAVLAVVLTLNTIAVDNETKSAEVTVEGGQILELAGGGVQVQEVGPTRGGSERKGKSRAARKGGAVEGKPIVLIHCYACSLHWWDPVVPLLAREHRVIRIDLLGFGGSEKPSSGYSMEDQAELVALALNRLNVEGAVVVGHSMGFDVTTALAEQSSELVDRVVNVDEAPDSGYGNLNLLAQLGYVPALGQLLRRITPDFLVKQGYEQAFAPGYDIDDGFDDPDRVIDDFRAMTYTSYDESGDLAGDYENEIPLDDRIANATVPLLVIFGEQDRIWEDPEEAARAYDDVPGARVAIIPGAGHSPNVEKPKETARLILEFAIDPGDEAESPEQQRKGKRR